MHSYFRLSPSSRLRRPLTIFGLPTQYRNAIDKSSFDKLDLAIVAYFSEEAREEISSVLCDPAFVISDELKRLLRLYIPDLEAKMVQLFAGEKDSHKSCPYWLPFFPPVNCLHKSTERYPDGSVKQIVLDNAALPR